ncbi:MAG TPA: prephenate dehydrogenase/arogenate dehydrogenase family protein [Anaerolineae bacterium]|nr:prephenate dehydrogenase/arogenate dehydrogenase family protein [Anaerolineae bacterium]HIQ12142.1 prephenate dehydrogenase/arogenate dehydrogenase family protein [Caldilineales bacterium]
MSQITIIGLGLIGTSIGLGLKALDGDFSILGHDRDHGAMQRAAKMGAVDKTHWNLIAAIEEADMIILAIPIDGVAPTFEAIKQDLKQGCLIMDTAPLKRPVQRAAAEHLPDHVHFIGSNPILPHGEELTPEEASPDLFREALWALCPTRDARANAVNIVTNLVQSLGASPYFLSPEEHDGLAAAAVSLPTLMAGALMHAVSAHASWREIRKMAGGQFARATALPNFNAEALAAMVFDNRDNVLLWIETMMAELEGWRGALQEEDKAVLDKWFEDAQTRRAQWLKLQETGDWEESGRTPIEPSGFFSRMLGLGGFSRKKAKAGRHD